MNLKILKKDLKRKKSMNFILLLFVMLATTFIAASVNNMKVVTNGVDYYFEKAGLSDFFINPISGVNGEKTENDKNIEEFLKNNEYVSSYSVDDGLMILEEQLEEIGDVKFDLTNTLTVFSVESDQQKYFDENNQELTDVEDGFVYVPRKMLSETLKIGDSFYIKIGNSKKKFTIKGAVKDALLGADMMGMNRVIIGQKDYNDLIQNGEYTSQKMYGVYCKDIEQFQQDYTNGNFYVMFADSIFAIRTTYVMDMVIAAILLVVSICLIIIAAIMLRFTIIFTVNEDYKEIGIMKAIGISNLSIRFLYITKYLVISIVGAVSGFFLSIPFGELLISGVTENIVVESSSSNFVMSCVVSILVVLVVVWFAFISTGKIKKFTPMDAIRSGNNGERFEKKNILSLGKSKMRPSTFMALNDVLCELKKYIILVITSMVGVWLVVMPVNTINTLQSEEVAAWFSMAPCDFYITEQSRIEENVIKADRMAYEEYLSEMKSKLEEMNIPVNYVATEAIFRYKISKGDYSYNSMALLGLGNDAARYMYEEGTAPQEANEIAITHVVAEKIHAQIGDTVYISMFDKEVPFLVTAIYQSMNNMGQGIRFAEEAEVDFRGIMGGLGVQVILKEEVDDEEKIDIMNNVAKEMPNVKVESTKELVDRMIGGISQQIKPIKTLTLTIVIIINILVVVLMQKMFLIREQGEMGMLKAMGFSNASIISWQTKRIALVLFIGVLLGTLTGTFFSELTSGQVFKFMGCSKIEFQINPWEVYVLYPVAIYVVTVLACVISMQKVKKISVDSMKDAE